MTVGRMQKVTTPYVRKYKSILLYKDDIEAIITTVGHECQYIRVKMAGHEYQGDDVGDLSWLSSLEDETIHDLEIVGYAKGENDWYLNNPTIFVNLEWPGPSIVVSDDHCLPLIGVAARLDTILHVRREWVHRVTTSAWILILVYAALLVLLNMLFNNTPPMNNLHVSPSHPFPDILLLIPGLIVLSAVTYLAFILGLRMYRTRYVTIHMHRYRERTNFWRRNKDAVVLAIISGFIGLVTGVIGTLLATALTRP